MTTLVAVAQRAKARFFRHDGPGTQLSEIRDLVHPESRAHGIALDTDRPGRTHDHGPTSAHDGVRSAMEREESSKERAAANFAREVAATIRDYRTHEGFDYLVLVAEPGFLGMLRGALDDTSAKKIAGEVNKEVVEHSVEQIAGHLRGIISV